MDSSSVGMIRVGFKTDVFSARLRTNINRMRNAKQYFDMQIVCHGYKIECHKLLLAGASPYFANVLADLSKCAYPVLVMNESKCAHVKWLVELVYGNEIRVKADEYMDFMHFLNRVWCSELYSVDESDLSLNLNSGSGLGLGGGQQIRNAERSTATSATPSTSTVQPPFTHDDGGMGNMQGQTATLRVGNRCGLYGGGVVNAFNDNGSRYAHLAPKRARVGTATAESGTIPLNMPVAQSAGSSGDCNDGLPINLALQRTHYMDVHHNSKFKGPTPPPAPPPPPPTPPPRMVMAHGSRKIPKNQNVPNSPKK